MEWNVKNAVSRDVERQHLNKILKEIQTSIESITAKQDVEGLDEVKALIGSMVEGNTEEGMSVEYDPENQVLNFTANDFTISLTGDVAGNGQVVGLSNVVIETTLDPTLTGIGEAPIDGTPYWRYGGEWERVPVAITGIGELEEEGFLTKHTNEDGDPVWDARSIEGEIGQIEVANPDGVEGNPTIGLAEVVPTDVGHNIVDTDEFGRVVGISPASYYYEVLTPSLTWTVNHNLGRKVVCKVFSLTGVEILAAMVNTNDNQLSVEFDSAQDGYAVVH